MALNVIAHWSLNDPTTLSRVWDNSGNKHHGDFGETKPEVVLDSPCGQRAMKWVEGASIILPEVENVLALSYWSKENDGWHSYVFSNGKYYVDAVEKGDFELETAIGQLKTLLEEGENWTVSDIYYYGAALSEEEIQKLLSVKTTITKDLTLNAKEFVEEQDKIQVKKAGIVNCKEIQDGKEKVSFAKSGDVFVGNIVEF